MGCHPRLDPFKFLNAHERVVRDPNKKKNKEKMLVESMETEAYYMLLMEMNVCKFGQLIYFFLILES